MQDILDIRLNNNASMPVWLMYLSLTYLADYLW